MHSIKNIGFRTDTIFHLRDGFVDEHADCFAIRTPANPSFWFGNFLLFKRAPIAGDFDDWISAHREVFGGALNHATFGWDEPTPGFVDEFVAVGFKTFNGLSLVLSAYDGSAKINSDLTVRKLRESSEWEAMLEQQVRVDREDFGYREDGGVFRMERLDGLAIAPGERAELAPGGTHLMLLGLAYRLVPGSVHRLESEFQY